jgi:acetyl-CoA carboxylase biotin carboxyl carrier protein
MDITLIKKLIQLLHDNNLGELTVKEGDLKISIKHRDFVKQQISGSSVVTPVTETSKSSKKEETSLEIATGSGIIIKAPMIGTFFRSADPDKEPFVKVGQKIIKGDVLCIIEAMKLFNEIQSEVSGTITKVLVDNSQAVEYDQPLFIVEPN